MKYTIKAIVTKISIEGKEISIQIDDQCCHNDVNVFGLEVNQKETEKCLRYVFESKEKLFTINKETLAFISNHLGEKITFTCDTNCENGQIISINGLEWERYK
jgi:hypothetical protein